MATKQIKSKKPKKNKKNKTLTIVCEACVLKEHPERIISTDGQLVITRPLGWMWSAYERGDRQTPTGIKYKIVPVKANKRMMKKYNQDPDSVRFVYMRTKQCFYLKEKK